MAIIALSSFNLALGQPLEKPIRLVVPYAPGGHIGYRHH
jgi:tripartite-type tricarboxylate transporter receptor subunit TctC